MMTDGGADIVWEASYLPYGEVASVTGPASLDYRFPGQWFQLESGLHYNWHRYYDATTGRYLQPDPLGMPDGPSRWAYVRNSPLIGVDPEGLADDLPGAMSFRGRRSRYESQPEIIPIDPMAKNDLTGLACLAALAIIQWTQPPEEPWPAISPEGLPILQNEKSGSGGAEHKKGARQSTKAKHEAGEARKKKDYGREKGDDYRDPPRKKPAGYKGPWPEK